MTRTPGLVLGTLGVAVALVIWVLLSFALQGGGGVINRLPGPLAVARELVKYATSELAIDLVSSLKVFVIGWLIGVVCATVLGLLLGRVRSLGNAFIPIVEAIRPVSSIAWVPLSVVWFGFGLTGKVFLVGLAVFLVVIVYAVDGSKRIPSDLMRTAGMLGMNGWQRFCFLILPGTLAEVLIGSRVALMAGWGTVIVAELVAARFRPRRPSDFRAAELPRAGGDGDDDLFRSHRILDERLVLASRASLDAVAATTGRVSR